MENRLRKRLALIKSRAKELSQGRLTRRSDARYDGPPIALTDAVHGCEQTIHGERFYRIRLEGGAIADDVPDVAKRFLEMSRRETWPIISLVKDPGPSMARRIRDGQLCFLDIETTGLSPNTYVFLCGLMYLDGCRFVTEQLFARDYSEERGMLLYLRDVVERYPMVVTYNGVGFDVPFLQTRMAVARIESMTPFEHVDLLEPAREHFKDVLADCRLETIERHLRGIARSGDIPSRDIPEAYHEFVRTGNARDMQRVLYHNLMDLLAMAYMVNYFAERQR
jgi:uncharacterized protein YprB with RNaseH-like and TPR domain